MAIALGVKSPATIFRWSKTEIWQQETQDLTDLEKAEFMREYKEKVNDTRKRLELSGLSSLSISLKLLSKLKDLCDRLKVEEINSPREQIAAIQALARGYDMMTDAGKTLWLESMGLDELLERLDLENK